MNIETILRAGPRALTPDVPMEIAKEVLALPSFKKAAEDIARAENTSMHREQAAVAMELRQYEHKLVDGLGTHYMRITQKEYLAMRAKYGDNCWEDADFVEAYRRDNPYCRVPVTRNTRGNEIVHAR
jgi:hypothetical protein